MIVPRSEKAAVHSMPGIAPTVAVAARVTAVTIGFALLHSALASHAAKAAAARLLGTRRRNGLYRVFFNTQAVVTSSALVYYISRLPDRELYVIPHPMAALMRAGQLAGVLLLTDAVRRVGLLPLAGVTSAASLARGDATVPPEAEAQGPSLDAGGELKVGGAFVRSRHPLNLAAVPILWLNPRMTRNLAVFSGLATAYFWFGSWHEERRLLSAYGEAYRPYMNSGVPFFLGTRTLIPGAPAERHGDSSSHPTILSGKE